MRSFHTVIVLFAIAAAAAAASVTRAHKQPVSPTHNESGSVASQAPVTVAPLHDTSVSFTQAGGHQHDSHDPHDARALADMHAYALHHFGSFTDRPETFRSTDQWDDTWVYRAVDITADGHTLHLCHATNRYDDSLRYVSAWDNKHERYGAWEAAY